MSRRPTFGPAVVALLLWAVGDKLTHAGRLAWESPGDGMARLDRVSPLLSEEFGGDRWWHLSTHTTDLLGGLALLLAALMVLAYQRAGRQTQRIGEEHGSATWGSKRDMSPFSPRKGEGGIAFTATETLAMDTYRTRRNLNCAVIGSSGSGKSRSFVLPNLLSGNGASFAVTDPKGELHRAAGAALEADGYDVRCLNLVTPRLSEGFNCMEYIDREQPEVDIAGLAETIVNNTEGQKTPGKDAFWDRAERALLTSLAAYVYFTGNLDGKDGEPPSLVGVVDLSKQLQASEEDEGYESGVDRKMADVRLLLEDWSDLPGMTKEESDHVRDGLHFATSQYRIFEQGAGETKKGVIISVGVRLAILDVPDVRRMLARDTLALDRLGQEKGAVFCLLPDTNRTFKFVAALFWRSIFNTNIYSADHSPEGRLAVPLQCYLDEFANIGTIPDFEQLIATIRSRGISAAIIVQALAQLKATYKDQWETIMGNCDSTLFLGGTEPSTLEWLSKRLGNETIKVEETSQSFGSHGSWSRSLRNVKRELMTPDELGRLPESECIYLLRGVPPFRSRKAALHLGAGQRHGSRQMTSRTR
ncbi:VirD4-like conjugal transfer protein, CD1115 family [Corynebacterium variabile]|uniref:VirD4-like conjugal transfer protein, CD1115 family n=1 Tax=Corynebacterium variabile TaxID=1727 RepID=UPI0028B074A0|nr:type IV secretory system conjugative DNA transfer family protein [Dietzia maris]